ncbi:hypothetical protein Ancab_035361 [Ancistrocladus abbreviatus]
MIHPFRLFIIVRPPPSMMRIAQQVTVVDAEEEEEEEEEECKQDMMPSMTMNFDSVVAGDVRRKNPKESLVEGRWWRRSVWNSHNWRQWPFVYWSRWCRCNIRWWLFAWNWRWW